MPADDVRDFFERVDAEPTAQFTESLLARLRAEYLRAAPDTSRDAERATPEADGPITIDIADEQPRMRRGRGPVRPSGPRTRRRIAVAAAAAVALIVVTGVLVRTVNDDDGVDRNVRTRPGPVATTDPPPPPVPDPSPPPLPDGLKGLPPEGATPSTPETGQLLARLPMPIWVYEDGRVISARWTSPAHWTGFLEQRLTPEGVELVRAEIRANKPFLDCEPGGPGGYGYSDGRRDVCEHATRICPCLWEDEYPRLWELPYGSPAWLPARAWADPEPKPYVPSTYAVWISTQTNPGQPPPPMDPSAMLALLPPEAAELLTGVTRCNFHVVGGPEGVCFELSTEDARLVAVALGAAGSTVQTQDEVGSDIGVPTAGFGIYGIRFLPNLPHDAPVSCCGG